jgi:hypothetical protein
MKTAITRQQLDKHISTAMDTHTAIEELSEVVFAVQFVLMLHNESTSQFICSCYHG